jgi:ribonuclease M5
VTLLIKLKEAIIVEGKYDKIKLENFIDAFILDIGGFRIFKDKEKCELIRALANKNGVIIMTDSDSAGMLIRSHLKGIVGKSNITQVYLPQIKGKEKRKIRPGAEGLLGVEGLSEEIITKALEIAGVVGEKKDKKSQKEINKTLLFELGLSGCENSGENRKKLYKYLNLPMCMQTNSLIEYLNTVYSLVEFKEVWDKCQKEKDNS